MLVPVVAPVLVAEAAFGASCVKAVKALCAADRLPDCKAWVSSWKLF